MAEVRGKIVNSGSIMDFAISGAQAAQDPRALQEIPLPGLLAWAAYGRVTGHLAITDPAGPVTDIVLKDGSLQTVEQRGSPLMAQVVEDMVSRNELTRDAANRSAAMAVATGRSQLQVIFEMGACTPKTLVEAIRSRKAASMDALLAMKEARYTLVDALPPGHRPDPVAIDLNAWMFALIRARTRMSYSSDMEPLLSSVLGKYPVRGPRLTPLILGTCMNDRERKVIDTLVDGTNATREVLTMSLIGRTQTARLLLACHILGLLEYRATPLPKGGIEALEAELRKTVERMEREDMFTRLGIHWTTHPSLIRPAFEKMTERWGPGSPVRTQSAEAARMADRIFALVEEAYAIVGNDQKRRAYRLELLGEPKMKFGTDLLYKQAHMAVFRNDIPLARQIIESAIDIIPAEQYLDLLRKLGG